MHDWLATNTDDITIQSHSLFASSREKNRQVENGLYYLKLQLIYYLSCPDRQKSCLEYFKED